MLISRSHSSVNFNHVHQNTNGECLLVDAIDAIIKQADFLTQYIDDELVHECNSDWVTLGQLKVFMTRLNNAHKKALGQVDKKKQIEVTKNLKAERQKIYVWRTAESMGKSFDTGLSCSSGFHNRMEVKDLLKVLTEQIEVNGQAIIDLDYKQACRYQILQQFKDGMVTVANKIGIAK